MSEAREVRICVCGDEGVGKSSICVSFINGIFVNKIQPVLPPVTLYPNLFPAPWKVTISIVDTSALPQDRETLKKEIRKCNCLLLVYADHYSYERVGLFWCSLFRSLGVNVPIVLCANKSDLVPSATESISQVIKNEVFQVMVDFKEIDSCIRTSAKNHYNISEVFFLCQKAVTHPIAPLFDSKESSLKPAAITAIKNVFHLIDEDQNGYLNDDEIRKFQHLCFDKNLDQEGLEETKQHIRRSIPDSVTDKGIDLRGFLTMMRSFIDIGKHESIWIILRKFHYTDSLSLQESFLHPKFIVPPYSSAELSLVGYCFFVDLFLLFDQDKSGGLNDTELSTLFTPCPAPGVPASWIDSPSSVVRNEAGEITLQGWLAQWSMTTFIEPRTTLEYLAYLGFDNKDRGATTTALKVTKARKRRKRPGRVERNVVLCYVLGASSSGKSSLLDAFLNRPFSQTYHPTIKPRTAVNSVELHGGKQCYLIMEELGELEPAILENHSKLDACDILCFTWDSADPDSWLHIVDIRRKYPYTQRVPAIFVGLKADKDKATQRSEMQPAEYTSSLGMPTPLHVSVTWNSISDFFVDIAESAIYPSTALPMGSDDPVDRTNLYIALSASVCALTALGVLLWRRTASSAA